MNVNRLTEKAQEAVVAAQQLATRSNHSQLDPEHLLSTLVAQQGGIVPAVLRRMQIDPAALGRVIEQDLSKRPKAYGGSEATLGSRMRGADRVGREGSGAAQGRVPQHRALPAGDRR